MLKKPFLIARIHEYRKKRLPVKGFSFWLKRIFLWGMVAGFSVAFIFVLAIFPSLPNVDNIQNLVAAQSSVILDREGGTLYTIHGDENRQLVAFSDIPTHVVQAAIAIEDDKFYSHFGIDIGGLIKAFCSELNLCPPRGGSTITQQFVKNAFLSSERTYTRKLKEIVLSLELEHKYKKDQILEMYLNRIPYGSNIYGVGVAAQKFFGKKPSELTLAEGAILASIPKSSTYYFPYGDHKYARIDMPDEEVFKRDIYTEQDVVDYNSDYISKGLLGKTYTFEFDGQTRDIYIQGRTDVVLKRMMEVGFISEDEMKAASQEAREKEFEPYREMIVAPHFVMYVKQLLEDKYGKDALEKGGLRITTTIDPKMQAAADEAVLKYGESIDNRFNASNTSLVAMHPETGEILAMVGSRDYWNDEIDGKVNIALRPRLPGSSFKPIVYAAAFLQGYAPSTILYDVATSFGGWYEPENFDGEFRGPVTMRQALANSLNIPAVKAAYLAGVHNVLDLARKMGIELNQDDDWYGLSLGLGAGEATLLDMVSAYSVFSNGGYQVKPVGILKIEDRYGNLVEEYQYSRRDLVLDPQAAYLVNDVLTDAEARPEGYWRNQLTIPGQINGAKTGTSNKKKVMPNGDEENFPFDVWTIGYTRHVAAGVWAGNADGAHLSAKASGLDVASPTWKYFMTEVHKDLPQVPFDQPDGIRWVNVSKRSGKLPSEHTPPEEIVPAVFASYSVPREYETSYQMVEIDKVSGKLATEYTPPEAREEKAFFAHHSILPDNANWEKGVEEWAKENGQDEEMPTEYDDVHTAETMNTKPEIQITSPVSGGTVSLPAIGVMVDAASPAGVEKVEYYWDDELMDTAIYAPFSGRIVIDANLSDGSFHVIKAVVFDRLYRLNQSSVQVKIGSDNTAPVVSFSYPAEDSVLPAGSFVTLQASAYDPNGGIKQLVLEFNGEQKTFNSPPYSWSVMLPARTGNYTAEATAYDYANNSSSKRLSFEVKNKNYNTDDYSILSPKKNTTFDNEPVLIQAYLKESTRSNLDSLEILVKPENNQPFVIKTFNEPASLYSFIWDQAISGRYEVYLKITLKDGGLRFSQRVPIVVR